MTDGRINAWDYGWRLYAMLVVIFGSGAASCLIYGWGTPAPWVGLAAFAATCWISWRRWQSHQRLVRSIVGVTSQGANVSLPLELRVLGEGIVPRVDRVIAETLIYWRDHGHPIVTETPWRGRVVEFVAHDRLTAGSASFGGIEAHGLVAGKFVGIAWGPTDTWSSIERKLRHECDHVALLAAGVGPPEHHGIMAAAGRP